MIYGLKGRLAKQNNREKQEAISIQLHDLKRKPFFIFSKDRGLTLQQGRFTPSVERLN
jgi:hypothetical protein